MKVPSVDAQIMIVIALALGTPCFILFGWLSDKIGRKPIMMAGFVLAALTYFPIFQGITHFANPKLEKALAASPVVVTADPAECSFQFKATGTETFTTGCDRIKAALVGLSVNYDNVDRAEGHAGEREDRQRQLIRPARRRRGGHRRGGEEPRLSGQRRPERDQQPDDGAAARPSSSST